MAGGFADPPPWYDPKTSLDSHVSRNSNEDNLRLVTLDGSQNVRRSMEEGTEFDGSNVHELFDGGGLRKTEDGEDASSNMKCGGHGLSLPA